LIEQPTKPLSGKRKAFERQQRNQQLISQPRVFQHAEPGTIDHTGAIWFPLSPDHLFLTLVANNVCRAIMVNNSIFKSLPPTIFSSFSTSCCDGLRTFSLGSSPAQLSLLPFSLQPTKLQMEVPHVSWIDLFPSPVLRDNLILALDSEASDVEELIMDLIGGIFNYMDSQSTEEKQRGDPPEHVSESQELGLVSWADPWTVDGWEVTESFWKKWRRLFDGCVDVLKATNNWRLLRGDDELV
jgi:hypothetical protein